MKKITGFIIIGVLTVTMVACAKKTDDKNENETKVKETTTAEQTVAPEKESTTEETVTKEVTVAEADFSFADMKDRVFSFLSGAGGWSTDLVINEDGSFSGTFHDTDYDIDSEGEASPIMYYCAFEGQFDELEKVDDLTYKTTIKSLTYANEVDTEEVIDGVKYKYSEAYGLDDHKDIIFYLEGSKVEDLPDEYINWVRMSMTDWDSNELPEELPFIGMYNENGKQGFNSFKYSENYEERINIMKESSDSLKKDMEEKEMTQTELNETAGQIHEMWDGLLNEMWSSLENQLPEDEMEALRDDERKWIIDKESELEKIKQKYESGSIMPMMYSLKAAELTEARVDVLLTYFK
ncbi:MAG: DUF1311 domain-containing protein [Lachnospiraceae bacterium]|nr:DUF1311 domain-containing protein [Lachnospiraceae bacterium]